MQNKIISVVCKNPNYAKELSLLLPSLQFKDILSALDHTDKEKFVKYSSNDIEKEKIDVLKNSEIIVADFDLIAPLIHDLPNAKWIQGTWAGVERLCEKINMNKIDSLPLITRFSGNCFGRMMSEYVVAHVINYERDFFKIYDNEKENNWISNSGKIVNYRCIDELTFGVMGIGNIGLRIAKTLNFLGGKVIGFGRQLERDISEMDYLSGYYNKTSLKHFLQQVDYVINVLPITAETRGLLNGNVLEVCKDKKPVFINIGRGSIINDNDLINSLNRKWMSGAILDVFNEEPLPKDSPLWIIPEIRISPHVSGVTRPKDVAKFFKDNYELYLQNKPLSPQVNFNIGY